MLLASLTLAKAQAKLNCSECCSFTVGPDFPHGPLMLPYITVAHALKSREHILITLCQHSTPLGLAQS